MTTLEQEVKLLAEECELRANTEKDWCRTCESRGNKRKAVQAERAYQVFSAIGQRLRNMLRGGRAHDPVDVKPFDLLRDS